MSPNLQDLPDDLPRPTDDGAAAHLEGMQLPAIALPATSGATVDIGALSGLAVLYVYPMTGRPDTPLPQGWDRIPGARGCTPQACSFRDHYSELQSLHAAVLGLSTQSTQFQREARERLGLPFDLLSDEGLQLKAGLRLPTFTADGMELYKRITLLAEDGRIRKVFYPVFPPDRNADDVIAWLTNPNPSKASFSGSLPGQLQGARSPE